MRELERILFKWWPTRISWTQSEEFFTLDSLGSPPKDTDFFEPTDVEPGSCVDHFQNSKIQFHVDNSNDGGGGGCGDLTYKIHLFFAINLTNEAPRRVGVFSHSGSFELGHLFLATN